MQNKPNFRKPKMNVNIYYTKDYKNIIPLAGQKTNPILSGLRCLLRSCRTDQTQLKPKQSQFKPNFRKTQNELKMACQKIRPHPKKLGFGIKLDFSNNNIRMPGRKTKIWVPARRGFSNQVTDDKLRNDCKTGHTQCRIPCGD